MYLPQLREDQTLIGLSVPVPQPWAGELQLARQNFGDPEAEFIAPHITIVGPTAVDMAEYQRIESYLAQLAAVTAPFTVHLKGTGSFWPTSPVVYVKVLDGAGECAALAQRCRAALPWQPMRFPYHPHVTVAQDLLDDELEVARRELASFEASFQVPALLLSEPATGGLWRIRRRFRFEA